MFCPKCGAEYREEFSECADCNVRLVEEPPSRPVPELRNSVTVFESSDLSLFSVAKSLLKGAGIEFWPINEGLQDLFGAGRLAGHNPLVGPAQIKVEAEHAEEAIALLKDLKTKDADDA